MKDFARSREIELEGYRSGENESRISDQIESMDGLVEIGRYLEGEDRVGRTGFYVRLLGRIPAYEGT